MTMSEQATPAVALSRPLDQLIERIKKLHWIGLEDEARALRTELHRNAPEEAVVTAPRETD